MLIIQHKYSGKVQEVVVCAKVIIELSGYSVLGEISNNLRRLLYKKKRKKERKGKNSLRLNDCYFTPEASLQKLPKSEFLSELSLG